jgi:iron(II)-dependent oxidoreductase
VDLTWHDARACCAWLTARWRAEGRIAPQETVRLPTEPEWEYAARGAQPDSAGITYPWQGAWQALRCNSEEAGLNATCAVGLFPAGASWCGAEDMAGNIWEWCSTLWGADMAAPRFRYPHAEDGREDTAAGPRVRRVLRGGCFSSGRERACCTYRGSLEPDGFWRGNGFRVVVS